MQSNRVRMVQIGWLENRIADLWPLHNTSDIAAELLVSEASIANALAHMWDRADPRLKAALPGHWTSIGDAASAVVEKLAAPR
jgi:hypothetical protein